MYPVVAVQVEVHLAHLEGDEVGAAGVDRETEEIVVGPEHWLQVFSVQTVMLFMPVIMATSRHCHYSRNGG